MKRTWKRLLALVLAAAMAMSLCAPVWAEELDPEEAVPVSAQSAGEAESAAEADASDEQESAPAPEAKKKETSALKAQETKTSLSGAAIEFTDTRFDYHYTGSALTPPIRVKLKDKTLTPGTDYTVTYSNNTNKGTATVRVTATADGKYTGSVSKTFTILARDLSNAQITGLPSSSEYNGKAQTPVPVVKLGSETIRTDQYTVKYENNINAGTAWVTITGRGNHTGSTSATFTITQVSLNGVTLNVSNQYYSAQALTPAITFSRNGTTFTLKKDTDYSATYSDNTDVGTATVSITGTGNYTGSARGSFTISPLAISKTTVDAIPNHVYTGSALCPEPVVTLNGKTLTAGTDYDVSYKNNTNAGTATITLTGKGNLSSSVNKTFRIVVEPLKEDDVPTIGAQTYTGKALTPDVAVTHGTKSLTKGTDYTVSYTDNVNVGTATATITGKGNYGGTFTRTFAITPADLSGFKVSAPKQTYSGQALTPALTFTKSDGTAVTLKKDTDYIVSYSNNINATSTGNLASFTVTGKGNYTGEKQGSFEIAPLAISKATVAAIADQTYTGSALTPAVTVKLGGTALKIGEDYSLTFSNNVKCGTATVSITGKGNFTSTTKKTFKIVSRSISEATVDAIPDQTYTGKALTPAVTIKLGSCTLVNGTDYTLAYKNNVNVGNATVTITGKGNYGGSATQTFVIKQANLSGFKVSAPKQTYSGQALTPAITFTQNGTAVTLKKDTDYTVSYTNNINATSTGNLASFTVTGKGNYQGTLNGSFEIAPLAISKATVAAIAEQTYTGSALCPEPAVTLNGTTLTKGKDYDLSYSNNVNKGTATVTITGKGNFTSTTRKTFKIVPKSISGATVDAIPAQTYTGKALTPAVTVKMDGNALVNGTDYTLAYKNNVNMGTATVIITGKGSYGGTATQTFAINPANIGDFKVSAPKQTYSGQALTPAITFTKNGTAVSLRKGTDYTVSFSNNINATSTGNLASFTVAGKGNYTDTSNGSFEIAPLDISKTTVAAIAEQTYTGSALSPEPAVTLNGTTLTKGKDFDLSYSNNRSVGTATVTLTGKGNFTSKTTKTFKIVPKSISEATVEAIAAQTYTGTALTPAVTVKLGSSTLVSGTDYTLAWKDNVNVGTASVTITGKGNYKGTLSGSFQIIPAKLDDFTVSVKAQSYAGTALTPAVTVSRNKPAATLKKGTDYTVAYDNNINAGTAAVTVTGKGNYEGTLKGSFAIKPLAISKATFQPIANEIYTGKEILSKPVITLKDYRLVEGTDYTLSYRNNVKKGTAYVIVTGKGNFTSSAEKSFLIVAYSLEGAKVSAIASQTYTGKAITPVPTVTLNGKNLKYKTDFDLAYANNTNVGTATANVVGKGNYGGTIPGSFTITQAKLAGFTISVASQTYTGKALEPAVKVSSKSTGTLKAGVDYTVTYANNINPGTASVTVTGKGNFTGEQKGSFTIASMPISKATVAALPESVFSGAAVCPKPEVTLNGSRLTEGTDYTLSYSSNTGVGTAYVTITGKGNFSSSVKKSFKILPRPLTTVTVSSIPNQTYTGKKLTPAVSVSVNGVTLKSGTDYTVKCTDNVNVGTATVTVTGKGNYTGSIQHNFTIVPRSIVDAQIKSIPDSGYSGSARTPIPTVSVNGQQLKDGVDFECEYENNIEVGTATVTITGKGNYTDSVTASFAIRPLSFKDARVSAIPDQRWTGKRVKPQPQVLLDDVELVKDVDYTLSYQNNRKVGTATVTVTGKGDYAGTIVQQFNILPTKTKFSKVTGAKGGLKAVWKRNKSGKGYELQCSTDKTFKKGVKTVKIAKNKVLKTTVKGLKKGRYYVRIRTVSGSFRSDWSKTKKAAVK